MADLVADLLYARMANSAQELGRYTMKQLVELGELAKDREIARLKETAFSMRAAFADGDGFKTFVKALEDGESGN